MIGTSVFIAATTAAMIDVTTTAAMIVVKTTARTGRMITATTSVMI
jgi:hypothetical protein